MYAVKGVSEFGRSNKKVWIVVGVLAFLLFLLKGVGNMESANRDLAVATTGPCGFEMVDVLRAYEAVTRGDLAALAGLADRSKTITLEAGVQVHEYMVSDKLSRVRITSGRHIGERCWIATGMLR